MSNSLAIAAVTAVLKDMLDNTLSDASIGASGSQPVLVSALPPQQIHPETDDRPRLNLFLYQVTPNPGWRNTDLPSRSPRGERVAAPPLALDLHYMLTAYGKKDFEAEILLGYAMQLLHETPVLSREAIRRTFAPPAPAGGGMLSEALQALTATDLAEQVEQIKLTPQPMGTEDISKLWAAFQAGYRPSVLYHASVVLIESARPARSPLPVLSIGSVDPQTGRPAGVLAQPSLQPPLPTLLELLPPNEQPAVRMGEILRLRGYLLYDEQLDARVRFTHIRSGAALELAPTKESSPAELTVRLPSEPVADPARDLSPNNPDSWRAGVYSVAVVLRKGAAIRRESNELPLILAPTIRSPKYQQDGNLLTATISCAPKVWRDQRVALVIGDRVAWAEAQPVQQEKIDQMAFVYRLQDLPAEHRWLRLRVDGVESLLIRRSGGRAGFDETQQVTL